MFVRRHGQEVAPQPRHVVGPVQPRGAVEQPCRVDHVTRPALVHVDADARLFVHERPRGPRVVEVDVRQEDRADVANVVPESAQPRSQGRQRRRWPGIDDRNAPVAVDHHRRDDLLDAEELDVDEADPGGEHAHRRPPASRQDTDPAIAQTSAPATAWLANPGTNSRIMQESS